MVVIRLSRAGAKKRPFYHIVVIDKRRRRDGGNYIERLGCYNPVARGQEQRLEMDVARAEHWMKQGAELSPRVASLLKEIQKVAA